MSKKNLVIVESPAKAKTIEKFLGSDYQVKSSFGHIRDLPKKGMSVDIENNFTPKYEVTPDKKKVVTELKKLAASADIVWLASDEDREGEAISWHLSEALKLDPKKTRRIVFHEITKPAILAAIENPRTVNVQLVDAQQARRVLDRIVGYELSPVLWKKVRPGLSAGRVQSVAVRLIVERERDITGFQAESTYKLTAIFALADGTELTAEASARYKTEAEARQVLEELSTSSFTIDAVEKAPGSRNPGAPFTTSTLQQEASRRLGFSPKQTMMLAQRLYEAGHITYMRTDSVNLSQLAIGAMGDYISKEFGDSYHQVRTFKTKAAGAQEAHEAIRPTSAAKTAAGADEQQKKLYQLIWRRALASQMAPAKLERTTITILASDSKAELVAKGEVIIFDGFLKLEPKRADDTLLPPVKKGDGLKLISATAAETLNRAPARYSEASLVRKLEEMGIGRPSTYAPTISTVQDRGYVVKGDVEGLERPLKRLSTTPNAVVEAVTEKVTVGADKNKLLPTDTGTLVTDFLVNHFPNIVDFDFTKEVEAEFDTIADGKLQWQKMLAEFYEPFHKTIAGAADISRAEVAQARTLGSHPKTGKIISARFGRFGAMVQMGEAEDDEKPQFAGIPSHLGIETITLEEAVKLFELPRTLGEDGQGNVIQANIGRFGPYIKIGSAYVSIKGSDPHTITLDEALAAIKDSQEKKASMEIKTFEDSPIRVLKGRYGPYITDGKKNAKIPKDVEPASLSLAQCQTLIKEAPAKKARFIRRKKA